MKRLLSLLFVLGLTLSACGGTSQTQSAPLVQTSTPSLVPTGTPSSTATQTPVPPTSTVTPTFDNLIQPYPFLTYTPNPIAVEEAQKWNVSSASISPNGLWAAISYPGKLKIVQVNGEKEFEVTCFTFTMCEFISPVDWSPDSTFLYIAPILTGESNVPFNQYTGIARININTEKFEKLIEDSQLEAEYSISLSSDGNYLAYTDRGEKDSNLTILETKTFQVIAFQQIDHGTDAGNIIWTANSNGIVFVSVINCISSVYFFDLQTKNLSTLVKEDPTCIKLLFMDEKYQVALSKFTYHPITNSYWFLDIFDGEFIPISQTE